MTDLVRYEDVVGQLRIYPDGAGPMDSYIGSGMVVWRNPQEVEIRGLKAEMTRRRWWAMVDLLRSKGVERLYAKRGPGRLLPYARPAADGWQVIDFSDVRRASPTTGPARPEHAAVPGR